MATPRSPDTFFRPNLAITEVTPAKNIEASAYRTQVVIVLEFDG
jgi:hypothetical protein